MGRYRDNFAIECIKEDLSNYGFYLSNHKRQLRELERINYDMTSLKAVNYSPVPTSGGTSKQEDRLINLIARKTRLEQDLKTTKHEAENLEDILNSFSERDREVVTVLWIKKVQGGAKYLSNKFFLSTSRIYGISDKVLGDLARIKYGLKDQGFK